MEARLRARRGVKAEDQIVENAVCQFVEGAVAGLCETGAGHGEEYKNACVTHYHNCVIASRLYRTLSPRGTVWKVGGGFDF